eukprot:3601518-Rhodomonas_salina.5
MISISRNSISNCHTTTNTTTNTDTNNTRHRTKTATPGKLTRLAPQEEAERWAVHGNDGVGGRKELHPVRQRLSRQRPSNARFGRDDLERVDGKGQDRTLDLVTVCKREPPESVGDQQDASRLDGTILDLGVASESDSSCCNATCAARTRQLWHRGVSVAVCSLRGA